jgi:hypothetical protein
MSYGFGVEHDGRHKSRLVAGGHLTDPGSDSSAYSSVVSLRGIRLVTFLSTLNGLELCGADVGNGYLEAKSKEKVNITGGPEFGELEGYIGDLQGIIWFVYIWFMFASAFF